VAARAARPLRHSVSDFLRKGRSVREFGGGLRHDGGTQQCDKRCHVKGGAESNRVGTTLSDKLWEKRGSF
jgi:hypothetical protein